MASIEINETKNVEVKFLKVEAHVRYWEDASVNGVDDTDGDAIPCREGDNWCPVIDIDSGTIQSWPTGFTAKVHYKVCDEGRYTLLDAAEKPIKTIDGYVPPILAPAGGSYGDYIILDINGGGEIYGWRVDLDAFAES